MNRRHRRSIPLDIKARTFSLSRQRANIWKKAEELKLWKSYSSDSSSSYFSSKDYIPLALQNKLDDRKLEAELKLKLAELQEKSRQEINEKINELRKKKREKDLGQSQVIKLQKKHDHKMFIKEQNRFGNKTWKKTAKEFELKYWGRYFTYLLLNNKFNRELKKYLKDLKESSMKRVNRKNKKMRKSGNKKKTAIEKLKYNRLHFKRCGVSRGYLKTKIRNRKIISTSGHCKEREKISFSDTISCCCAEELNELIENKSRISQLNIKASIIETPKVLQPKYEIIKAASMTSSQMEGLKNILGIVSDDDEPSPFYAEPVKSRSLDDVMCWQKIPSETTSEDIKSSDIISLVWEDLLPASSGKIVFDDKNSIKTSNGNAIIDHTVKEHSHESLALLMQISRKPSFNELCNTWLNKQNGTSVDREQIRSEIRTETSEINNENVSFELGNYNEHTTNELADYSQKKRIEIDRANRNSPINNEDHEHSEDQYEYFDEWMYSDQTKLDLKDNKPKLRSFFEKFKNTALAISDTISNELYQTFHPTKTPKDRAIERNKAISETLFFFF